MAGRTGVVPTGCPAQFPKEIGQPIVVEFFIINGKICN